ncbi:MAG: DUF2183 domain-containing protein [Alphaproteobacteria bacterium]|nr:DUF2183 domain-containing protein [Alphaproteobacteria bacterium]
MSARWRTGAEQVLRRLVKSASQTARRGKVVVQTYRGYGSVRRIFLMGRVLREPSPAAPSGQGLWSNLRLVWRRMRAWGLDDVALSVRFGKAKTTVRTDRDGYFRLDLELPEAPPADQLWHRVAIRLDQPVAIDVEGDVFIPRDDCRLAVISDIDDTIMRTGVANKVMMMWRLFVQGADSRTAFPGMAPFLRALHCGPEQGEANPMLYVSRAPWAIYGVLDRFFNLHGIPEGPILFLRDWGLTLQHPLPRRGKGHKINLIRQMITHYDDLQFILIGDSGQHDPEIYAEIARSHPGRVRAVYIRDVSTAPGRDQAIARMASDFQANGCSLLLAADTMAMARHAADEGLIADAALNEIATEIKAAP